VIKIAAPSYVYLARDAGDISRANDHKARVRGKMRGGEVEVWHCRSGGESEEHIHHTRAHSLDSHLVRRDGEIRRSIAIDITHRTGDSSKLTYFRRSQDLTTETRACGDGGKGSIRQYRHVFAPVDHEHGASQGDKILCVAIGTQQEIVISVTVQISSLTDGRSEAAICVMAQESDCHRGIN
jgi:hypothetical protein